MAIRPEHIRLLTDKPDTSRGNLFEGSIVRMHDQGIISEIEVTVSTTHLQLIMTTSQIHQWELTPGQRVYVSVPPEHIHLL